MKPQYHVLLSAVLISAISLVGCAPTGDPAHHQTCEDCDQEGGPDIFYEVVGIAEDGGAILQVEVTDFVAETRTRIVQDDSGRSREEVTTEMTPVTKVMTLTVPGGRDIEDFLAEQFDQRDNAIGSDSAPDAEDLSPAPL